MPRVAAITMEQRRQIVSLRKAGMTVGEIARRLDMQKSSQMKAIQAVCEPLGRKFGDLSVASPVYRKAGATQ